MLLFIYTLALATSMPQIERKIGDLKPICSGYKLGETGSVNYDPVTQSFYPTHDVNLYMLKYASSVYAGTTSDPYGNNYEWNVVAFAGVPNPVTLVRDLHIRFLAMKPDTNECSYKYENISDGTDIIHSVQWVKHGGYWRKSYVKTGKYSYETVGQHGIIAVSSTGRIYDGMITDFQESDYPEVLVYQMFPNENDNNEYPIPLIGKKKPLLKGTKGMYPAVARAVPVDYLNPTNVECKLKTIEFPDPGFPGIVNVCDSNMYNIVVYIDDFDFVHYTEGENMNPEFPFYGDVPVPYWIGKRISYKIFNNLGVVLSEGYIPQSKVGDNDPYWKTGDVDMVNHPDVVWNNKIQRFVVKWDSRQRNEAGQLQTEYRTATIDINGNVDPENGFRYICNWNGMKWGYHYCEVTNMAFNEDKSLWDDGLVPPEYEAMPFLAAYDGTFWLKSWGEQILYQGDNANEQRVSSYAEVIPTYSVPTTFSESIYVQFGMVGIGYGLYEPVLYTYEKPNGYWYINNNGIRDYEYYNYDNLMRTLMGLPEFLDYEIYSGYYTWGTQSTTISKTERTVGNVVVVQDDLNEGTYIIYHSANLGDILQ